MTTSTVGDVFGWIAFVLYMIPVFPQIYKNWKTKNVYGLSIAMFIISTVSSVCFASYAYVANMAFPMRLQAYIYSASCCVVIGQIVFYGWKYGKIPSVGLTLGSMLFFGGIQAGLIFAMQALERQGATWLNIFIVSFSVFLAFAQFVAQIVTIFKVKDARALSWWFLVLYLAGGCAFLGSMVADVALVGAKFDWLGALGFAVSAGCILFLMVLKVVYGEKRFKKVMGDVDACSSKAMSLDDAGSLGDVESKGFVKSEEQDGFCKVQLVA